MINISGANRMLYYRDLKVGTLDLAPAAVGAVAQLLAAKPVRANQLFPDAINLQAAVKSLKAISTKARGYAEEFGIHVTYAASGFATWVVEPDEPEGEGRARATTPPRAPVLLRQVEITPRPGSIDGFELAVRSEAQVNPVLLHLLEAQYGIPVDDAALLEQSVDDNDFFERFVKTCEPSLTGFRVDPGLVLGTFYYAEQPLVEDLLEERAPFLAGSDLVAALAGDEAASERVRRAGGAVANDAPDRCPPSDEYLVLDADGSQSYVINAVVAGQNLVVQGPPGTGKSQTIANVIAELVARNKRVLFVAQKRAAITAVLRRLQETALDHLVMDMFTAGLSRRAVVEEVSRAVEQRKRTARPRVDATHRRFAENRDLLVRSRDALHEPRQPWDLPLAGSLDDDGEPILGLYDWAIETGESARPVRLAYADLMRWSESTHDELRDTVADFVATGGTDPTLAEPGWSLRALTTADIVAESDELVATILGDLLSAATSALNALAAEMGVPPTATPDEAQAMLGLAGTLARLVSSGVSTALTPERSDQELASEIYALGSRAERKADAVKLGTFARRKVAKTAATRFPDAAPAELRRLLAEAADVRGRWRAISRRPVPPLPPAGLGDARSRWNALSDAVTRLQPRVQGITLNGLRFEALAAVLQQLAGDSIHRRYPRLHTLRAALVAAGCEPLLQDLVATAPADPDEASRRLTQAFAMTVIEHIHRTDTRLAGIDAAVRDRAAAEFAGADVELRQANAQRVRRAAAELLANVLDDEPVQAEVLRDQLRRKRGFKPVRQLMTEAPDVLLAAKPVWAASPQAVSEFLPAAQLFDVVLFDEASQIQPAAALPAIARGAQTVVAGDSLQLPPTTLFTRTIDALLDDTDAYDEDPDDDPTGLVVHDMESILDAVETKLGPQRSRHLSWHYRSRDERLIATSNTWVYRPRGRQMTTFPAADGSGSLRHVLVPFSPGLGPNNRSPRLEVQAVVDLVLDHARSRPGRSLGVIAFGTEHANRIQAEIEKRLSDESEDVRAWFAPAGDEPFFVKNIERVQGDERDSIILTVGYARGNDGQLRYSWGPVLQEGGHRRVNVAISRAKSEIVLVTSFAADEVDERASEREGFQLMRRFITFAATGGSDFGDDGAQPVELNPFEYDVLRRLTEAGLDVTPQYGVGSYRLDFAVRHPLQPGRFLLAVEADGAAYHSGVVARERDRLRQQVLESRGWRFVRIWSTDYFRDPDSQIERVVTAYNEALNDTPPPAVEAPPMPAWDDQPVRRDRRPPVPRGLAIGQYTDDQLDDMVVWACSDDLPHTRDEVFEIVKTDLGFQKNGKIIVERIRAAIDRQM